MDWRLKAIVQKTISYLPGKTRINFWMQKHITRGVRLTDAYLEDKLMHLPKHLEILAPPPTETSRKVIVEIGTGWYPILPISFFLCGFDRIYTFDIYPWMNTPRIQESVRVLLNHIDAFPAFWEPLISEERLHRLQAIDFDELTDDQLEDQLNIQYLVGPSGTLPTFEEPPQYVVSNNVLEHIRPQQLHQLFLQLKELLPDSGVMSHFIDMSDHFAHTDPKINIYHFLRFTEKQWKWIDNTLQPQNRWRMQDYLELFHQLGFDIFHRDYRPGDTEQVRATPLAAPWCDRPTEEVAISHCYLGMRKG